MMGDAESRLEWAEYVINGMQAAILNMQAQIAQLQSQVQQLGTAGGGAGGSGAGVEYWFYAPTGIAAASVSGTTPNFVIGPSHATDTLVLNYDASSGNWLETANKPVYNDYPNSAGAGLAPGHFGPCYLDSYGNYRARNEQC